MPPAAGPRKAVAGHRNAEQRRAAGGTATGKNFNQLPAFVCLLRVVTPKGVPHLALCSARATREGPWSKLKEPLPRRKIGVTSKTPVGVISVVTLIRTDTTLDHSQKAEKV